MTFLVVDESCFVLQNWFGWVPGYIVAPMRLVGKESF